MGKKQAAKIVRDEMNGKSNNDIEVVAILYLTEQIEKLQNANLYFEGQEEVVNNRDADGICSPNDIDRIRNKSIYVAMIFHMSLKHYEPVNNFNEIIKLAMEKVNQAHLASFIPENKRCKTNFVTIDTRKCYKWF